MDILKKYILNIFMAILAVIAGFYFVTPKIQEIATKAPELQDKKVKIEDLRNAVELSKQKAMEEANKKAEEEENVEEKDTKLIYENSTEGGNAYSKMLESMIELAKSSGLKIKSIETVDPPESDPIIQQHATTHSAFLFKTQLIGTYSQLQTFLREVYRNEYLIGIEQLQVIPYERDKKILVIDLSLILYLKR